MKGTTSVDASWPGKADNMLALPFAGVIFFLSVFNRSVCVFSASFIFLLVYNISTFSAPSSSFPEHSVAGFALCE